MLGISMFCDETWTKVQKGFMSTLVLNSKTVSTSQLWTSVSLDQ
jgi:hypothetical protein